MKRIVFSFLGLAFVCLQPELLAQPDRGSELKKYPDIAYRERGFQLFRFLAVDKMNEKRLQPSSEEYQRMDRAVTIICLELTEAGIFINLGKPMRQDRLARLSPAGRAFYDYYQEALSKNPVFGDLYTPLPAKKADLYVAYRNYQLQTRSESERQAYDAAASVLDSIIGGQDKPSHFRLVMVGGVALLAMLGVVFLVIYLRRRSSKKKQ